MRVLVTGGNGFVGRHLINRLVLERHDVVNLDFNSPFGCVEDFLLDVESDNARAPLDYYAVFHLAANIRNINDRLNGGLSTYDDIALDLRFFKWLERHKPVPQVVVAMSSCAIDFPDDPYCIVKQSLEAFAKNLYRNKDIKTVILRPFSGYGSDQSPEYPFGALLGRVLRKEDPLQVWGGSQVRDFVHIDDLVTALTMAMKGVFPYGSPIEVGTGKGTSLFELACKFAEFSDYNPKIFCDSTKPMSSGYRVAGAIDHLQAQSYGWKPKVTLEEGIVRAINANDKPKELAAKHR